MITNHAKLIKRLPSIIYKLVAQAWYDPKFPRHIFLETTSACNLSCEYCPRVRESHHMDFSLLKRIVDEASSHGRISFSLHLFGEPLLYPRIIEAIRYIKKRGHTVLLTTNGTLLERFYEDLKESRVDQVIWTERKEVKWSKEFREKLREWRKFTVRRLGTEVLDPRWERVETESLHNYGGHISTCGAQGTGGSRYPCYHFWYAPAVSWSGNILVCCNDPMQSYVVGNVKELSIAQAWKRMDSVRAEVLKGKYPALCKDCNVWKKYPSTFFSWQYTT